MAKIKITTLTDKIKDEEILSKLKSIGVKIKEKEKEKEEHGALGDNEIHGIGGDLHRKEGSFHYHQKEGAAAAPAEVKEVEPEPQKAPPATGRDE